MRLRELVREAVRSAASSRVPTALVAVLVAAMCLTTILTVGRAAAAQERVQRRLEDAGSRVLELVDKKGHGFLTGTVVAQTAGLSTVDRAVGLGIPRDVTNATIGPGGTPVPAWTVLGDLGTALELVQGRWPRPGEGIVSVSAQRALGLDAPLGAVTTVDRAERCPVVGAFRARAPFADLDAGVVVAGSAQESAHTLRVVASHAAAAPATQAAVLALLARTDPDELTVRSPTTLAELQGEVVGDLARYNRTLLLAVMATGALLVGVVSAADVLLRRRDLGRRRALGAPRWALMVLVVVRATCGAAGGAVVASALGMVLTARVGQAPPWTFVVGAGVLGVLVAAGASIPPAIVAARQDPVRVLRTP